MTLIQFAAWASMVCLAGASEPAPSFDAARALYLKGVEGNREASRDSLKFFEKLHQERPNDGRVLAYLGSVRVLESGRTMALWKRGKLAKEGLQALDQAVEASPEALEVRFLRGVSTYYLPGWFGREQQCAADLALIAANAEKAASSGWLDKRYAAAALFHHGLVLEKRGDLTAAQQAWKAAVRVAPDSNTAGKATQRLKGH